MGAKYPPIDWRNPNYDEIKTIRVARYARIKAAAKEDPTVWDSLKKFYARPENIVAFINDWGSTFDPRNPGRGIPALTPFVLFPRQEDFIRWVLEMYETERRGLGEKTRDVGFTWLAAAIASWFLLFVPDAVVGFGSRKEDLVDHAGDPDSIFWKIRTFIETLPPELKPGAWATPEGFKRSCQHMLITNPETKSVIKGEAGDEIGRGGRTTIYFVDEAAFLARPLLAEASLSANTRCRIDISTVNGIGNVFYDNRHKFPAEQIFVFDWTDDPRKRCNPDLPETSEPWYVAKKAELDAAVFASEVERDYGASIANTFVPPSLVIEAERFPSDRVVQGNDVTWSVGLDAARTGVDESVLHLRLGRVNMAAKVWRGLDGHQLAAVVLAELRRCLQVAPVGVLTVELDGPGASAYDVLKRDATFGRIVRGIHTSSRMNTGQDYNLRAWLHRQAKEYLEEGNCSLARDPIFRTQATSLLFEYKGGKLLIESKADYKRRFAKTKSKAGQAAGPSPDRWDAFILSFMPAKARPVVEERNDIWMPGDAAVGY